VKIKAKKRLSQRERILFRVKMKTDEEREKTSKERDMFSQTVRGTNGKTGRK
jgi:hypothetical protein